MAREDLGSFFFLSNYLFGSCLKLSDQGVPIEQIETRYLAILNNLCEIYKAAPQPTGEVEFLRFHKNSQTKESLPDCSIDLRSQPNK